MIKGEIEVSLKHIQRKLPPGYLGFPIHREIKFFVTMAKGGIGESLRNARRKYGTFFLQSFLGDTSIICGGQEDLAWAFNNDRKSYTEVSWPPTISMLLGPGAIANQNGKYHRTLRRLVEPYFLPKFVNNYLKVMDQTTVEELNNWAKSGEFLSSEVFKMYALRLFYVSAFGRVDEYQLVQLHHDFKIWLSGFMSVSSLRVPGSGFDEAMKARDRILDIVDTLIDVFMKENPEDSERAQTTIVGRLIYGRDKDENRVLTRDEMNDNLLLLIFAGHDTTYASLSTLLYHLSENPDAMDALTEEVSTLSEPLQSDELKNAPVMNACMHESWRMDPPIIGGFRKSNKDGLQHKGYSFDKGTVFNYSVLMATEDETLFKSHEKFNMRRFLPKSHHLYSSVDDSGIDPLQGRANYPIFGGGTHICLGKAFAQLEMRVFLARMFKHYKLEVRNPEKEYFPVNGWKVEFKLTKRKEA